MINLYIIRHGETAGNVRRLIQGVTNSHLNARGRKQAYALGVGLRISGLKVERIVASDLIRAQETAQQILLGMQKKLPVETDSGLREQNDGIFEGRELEDVSQEVFQVPDYHQLVTSGKVPIEAIADGFHAADTTNQAEDSQQVIARYDFALRRIVAAAETAGQSNVLVVSHGTAGKALHNFPHMRVIIVENSHAAAAEQRPLPLWFCASMGCNSPRNSLSG